MIFKKKSIDIVEMIDTLLLNRLVDKDEEKIQMLKEMVNKMSIELKEDFMRSFCLDLYVSDIKNAEIELQSHMIKKVSNFWLVYLFREIVRSDFQLGKKDVRIQLFEYTKRGYEAKEFLNTLMNSVTYLDRGITLDLDSIENILTGNDKKAYAKGAKKSVIHTLTGKKKEKSFRPHPRAKNEIVVIEELGKYLSLEDKHKRLNCPVCSEEYDVDKHNIDNVIKIKGNIFIFHCIHARMENGEKVNEPCFQKDLGSYFKGKHSNREKQMFVLNNFKKIVGNQ